MECHILIADSQPLMAESIRQVLKSAFSAASFTLSFEAAQVLKSIKTSPPTFIILDASIAKPDGLSFCEKIKKASPASKTLVFSADDDPGTVMDYFRKGVDGYLLKEASGGKLLNAVAVIESGETYLDISLKQTLSFYTVDKSQKKKERPNITKRELEILNLIVAGNTTKAIAQLLFISPETVESHRVHLVQKFGVSNTAGLVREAFLRGALHEPVYSGKP